MYKETTHRDTDTNTHKCSYCSSALETPGNSGKLELREQMSGRRWRLEHLQGPLISGNQGWEEDSEVTRAQCCHLCHSTEGRRIWGKHRHPVTHSGLWSQLLRQPKELDPEVELLLGARGSLPQGTDLQWPDPTPTISLSSQPLPLASCSLAFSQEPGLPLTLRWGPLAWAPTEPAVT